VLENEALVTHGFEALDSFITTVVIFNPTEEEI
jgi:hypothetical protein